MTTVAISTNLCFYKTHCSFPEFCYNWEIFTRFSDIILNLNIRFSLNRSRSLKIHFSNCLRHNDEIQGPVFDSDIPWYPARESYTSWHLFHCPTVASSHWKSWRKKQHSWCTIIWSFSFQWFNSKCGNSIDVSSRIHGRNMSSPLSFVLRITNCTVSLIHRGHLQNYFLIYKICWNTDFSYMLFSFHPL